VLENAPPGWTLKSTKQVYENYYLTVYEDMLNLAGTPKKYIRAERQNYSTIVPFTSDGRILTIKSYRHLVDSYQIEVPSGYIDEGESPEQAAVRELEEETGFVAEKMLPVGSYTLDYSMIIQTGYIFAAYGLENKGRQQLGNMEILEMEFLPVQQIKDLLLGGKILNAASIVALYRAIEFDSRLGK